MQTAMRLSGVSVLLADMALVAGMIISGVHGLGTEALPLTSPQGLQHLGRSAEWYTLRETLWLAYPIFVLPQGIALYALLRDRAPTLLWPLVLWCVGLTLGIGVDVATVGIARGFGLLYLTAGVETRPLIESVGQTIAHATLLAQFVCDTMSGTLVYPFFAVAAYRARFISRGLGLTVVISSILVFVMYRGMNLTLGEGTTLSTVCGLGVYGLIWWDVSIAAKLLRVRSVDLGDMHMVTEGPTRRASHG